MKTLFRLFCLALGATGLLPTLALAETPAIRVSQAGLSGSWSDPTTPEQKILLQILPDAATGKAVVLGGWFTFADTVLTDARSQRWYTLQGNPANAETASALTIFESTQGTFAQAGEVVTTAVGSATLSFSDCMHGTLDYAFSNEATRKGTIRLQRQGSIVACADDGVASPAFAVAGLGGAWYEPETSGQNLYIDLDAAQGSLSAVWSTYPPAGNPQIEGVWRERWFSLRAPISDLADMRDIPIYSWVGGTFATHNPPPTAVHVGSASLAFADCDHATLTYAFSAGDHVGLSGTRALRHARTAQTCDTSAMRIPGHVKVPAGINTADLTVLSAFSETGVDAHGDFTLPRTGAAPSITGVVHVTGGALYFGALDSAVAADLNFDAHSTAVALLFQAIGGTVLTGEQRRHVLALIAADPATNALADVIAAEQAKDPFVLENISQPILASIGSIVRGWVPSPASLSGLRSASRLMRAALRPFIAAANTTAGSADDTSPQQLLIVGETQLSGFTLNLGDGNNSVVVQNSKRRPGLVHVFTTGYTDADGIHTDLPLVEEQGDGVPVPATRRLSTWSSFTSIGSLLSSVLTGKDLPTGTIPWSPIDSPPIIISGKDGAVTTDVDVLVLTGVWNGNENAFAGNYGVQAGTLKNDLFLLRAKQVLDATVIAVLENLGIGGAVIADIPLVTVKAFVATTFTAPSFSEIYAAIAEGRNLAGALDKILRFLPLNAGEAASANLAAAQLRQQIFDEAMAQYTAANSEILGQMSAEGIAYNQAKLEAAATNARAQLANATKKVLLVVSAVLAGVDTIAQGVDQFNGDDSANFFHVKVIRPTLRLEPRDGQVNLGDSLKFKATLRGYEDDPSISYSWTLGSKDQSILIDPSGNKVAGDGSFDSTSREVSFVTGSLITRTDIDHTVTVQVFHKDRNGYIELFGSAAAAVTVGGYQVALAPSEVTMRHDQQRAFGIEIDPLPPDLSALQYEWSTDTAGRCGTLTSAGISNSAAQPVITTKSAHATYAGDASNPPNCTAELVMVTLFTMTDGVRTDIGKADATIAFTDFDIVLPAVAPVHTNATATVSATLAPVPPAGSTVVWTWSVSGDGSLAGQSDNGVNGSSITLHAGTLAGIATASVQAAVTRNGVTQYLQAKTRQIEISASAVTPVTSGPVQYYVTDLCAIAYVTLPRVAGATQYRITQVSGVNTLGTTPSNTTGGFTVAEPARVFAGLVYDAFDTPINVSCSLSPLNGTLSGDAGSLRLALGRALNVDGTPTPSWTAAWAALFHDAYDGASIQADAIP